MRPLESKHHVPRRLIVRRLDWRGPQRGGSLVALRPRISPGLPLSHSPLSESVNAYGNSRLRCQFFDDSFLMIVTVLPELKLVDFASRRRRANERFGAKHLSEAVCRCGAVSLLSIPWD